MISVINRVRCHLCKGTGFVKTEIIKCKICQGKKCISCNDSGLSQLPWSLCEKCDSSGEIIITENKKESK
jgi:DnaJ-class molecular chaperone